MAGLYLNSLADSGRIYNSGNGRGFLYGN